MSISSVLKTPLTDPQIRDLIRQAQLGDPEAREKVILAYLPLAQTYAQKYHGYGVPFDDLYQEACYGIMVALVKYDPDRKERFATVASQYISKYIRCNALQKQNSSIPSCYNRNFYFEIKEYISAVENFKERFGAEPSDEEMSECLNISMIRLQRRKLAAEAFMCPAHDFDLENYTEDIAFRPVEEEVLRRDSRSDLANPKAALTKREIEVLERRFGFTDSGEPEKWEEISAAMGLHIETLRLSYNSAIRKLRKVHNVGLVDTPHR